jgi:hypothetical protein
MIYILHHSPALSSIILANESHPEPSPAALLKTAAHPPPARLSAAFPRGSRSALPSCNPPARARPKTPALAPLIMYLRACCLGRCSGISFVDSTSLDVCLNQRIHCHKGFDGLAARGKTSIGWFFGFKLHWVVNVELVIAGAAEPHTRTGVGGRGIVAHPHSEIHRVGVF